MMKDGEDVTYVFYWLSTAGMTILLISALLYHISMSYQTRVFNYIANLATLVWFVAL